jgi:hypothetical protein
MFSLSIVHQRFSSERGDRPPLRAQPYSSHRCERSPWHECPVIGQRIGGLLAIKAAVKNQGLVHTISFNIASCRLSITLASQDHSTTGRRDFRSRGGPADAVIPSTRPETVSGNVSASRPLCAPKRHCGGRERPHRSQRSSCFPSSTLGHAAAFVALRNAEMPHCFTMTTSRYSLGTTIVSSPALFMRAMRESSSFSRSFCCRVSRAEKALSIGP